MRVSDRVACGVEYIKGLFDSPESIFENDHFFCMPKLADGSMPFSDNELKQILRELAIGIYTYDTVPFFSLHFNQNADLVPVIHPVYENTLVGRVISMLDYIMKGYLNGGTYQEAFIDQWHEDPNWKYKTSSALQQLIEFELYCHRELQGKDKIYISLRDMKELMKDEGGILGAGFEKIANQLGMSSSSESPTLKSFSGFTNSFRIIAKQNSIQKEKKLFVIDSDFDVFYTINPSPEYQEALDQHLRKYGHMASSYQSMIHAYEFMKERIHDHMVKMPLCQNYFSMLAVINFFSSYFSTLKRHRKIPVLPAFEIGRVKGSPSLFPHLPVKTTTPEQISYNPFRVLQNILIKNEKVEALFYHLLRQGSFSTDPITLVNTRWKEDFLDPLEAEIKKNIMASCSPLLTHLIHTKDHPIREVIEKSSRELSSQIANEVFQAFCLWIEECRKIRLKTDLLLPVVPSSLVGSYQFLQSVGLNFSELSHDKLKRIVNEFFLKILSAFPCVEQDILKKPFICSQTRLKSAMSFEEVEEGKKIVGGCGMDLKVQTVQPSLKAVDILRENWSKMIALKPESWCEVSCKEAAPLALFRLLLEDVPSMIHDDYEWMESLLFVQKGEEAEQIAARMEIQHAMVTENVETFSSLIQTRNDLHHLKDRYQRTLLHFAAGLENPFYLKSLLKKGLLFRKQDVQGYLPIHYAAMGGTIETLELLIEKDYSRKTVDARSKNGSTPLIVAIQNNQQSAVKILLEHRVSFSQLIEGYNPLHCALHQGNLPIANMLLDQKEISSQCLNELSEEEGTPLMLACELDTPEIVQRMIQMGADPTTKRKDGITAIEIAITRNCLPVLEILLQYTNPTNHAIETAAKNGSVQVMQLLSKKIQIFLHRNSYKDTILHSAIRYGNVPLVTFLINTSSDLQFVSAKNLGGETAIRMASKAGLWGVIEQLFYKGAITDFAPLLKAKFHPLLEKIFDSLQHTVRDMQRYFLMAAQSGNHQAITKILIPKGILIRRFDGTNGWQILHYLAKCDGLDLFKTLISESKNLLHPINEEQNKTLPYIAAENGSHKVSRFLLEEMKKQGIPLDKHYQDKHLFYGAILSDSLDQVQMFLDLFKESNLANECLDQQKTRPVHLAAKIASLSILKLLCDRGADISLTDADGYTALDYAVRSDAIDMITYLLEKYPHPITTMAVYLAASQKNTTVLKILTNQKGYKKAADIALSRTVRDHNTQAFYHLLAFGVPLEYVTPKGWTPLLIASSTGQHEIVSTLLNMSPSDSRTINGNNALDLACKNRHAPCVSLLLKAGFKRNVEEQISVATHGYALSFALGHMNEKYQQSIANFTAALQDDDSAKIEQAIENLPINESILIDHEGRKIWGTPLQLLLHTDKEKFVSISQKFFQTKKKINFQIQDCNGNTLIHLLVAANISLNQYSHLLDASTISQLIICKNHEGQTPLHYAAQYASTKNLSILLERIKEIDVIDNKGRTALFYAVEGNKKENLSVLIDKGANLHQYDYQLITPLLYVCQQMSVAMAKILLQYGANPNQIGSIYRITPLHLAIQHESDEMTYCLIFHGANCEITTADGTHPIHLAAGQAKNHLLRLFAAKGISLQIKDNIGRQAIHTAAMRGKTATVAAILENTHISVDTAVEAEDNKEEARLLNGATPLHLAAGAGSSETIQYLLKSHANPETKTSIGMNALSWAAATASKSTLELFFPYSLSQNPKHLRSALVRAIIHDNLGAMIALYQRGVTIHIELQQGFTGLHLACSSGALHCTQWLLQNGANPHYPCATNENSWELAATNNSYEQFRLLLDYTMPDLDQTNGRGETLIHISSRKGNLHHVILLIMNGASINEQDGRGYTPLHVASKEGHTKIVQILLFCGADFSVKSPNGKLAIDLAQNQEIEQLFIEFQNLSQTGENTLNLAKKSQNDLAVLLLTHLQKKDQQENDKVLPLNPKKFLSDHSIERKLSTQPIKTKIQLTLLEVIQGPMQLPSKQAGLELSDIDEPTIRLIDDQYQRSMMQYKQDLAKANAEDKAVVNSMTLDHQWLPLTAAMTTASTFVTASAGLRRLGKIGDSLGTIAAIASLGIAGFFAAGVITEEVINNQIASKGNISQILCLMSIKELEIQRVKRVKNQIRNSCGPLVDNLQLLERQGQTSKDCAQRLDQLYRVYQITLPGKLLKINEIDIGKFLQLLKQKFPIVMSKRRNPLLLQPKKASESKVKKSQTALKEPNQKLLEELDRIIPSPQQVLTEGEIDSLLKRFAGEDTNTQFPLSQKELQTIREQFIIIEGHCKAWNSNRMSTLVNMASEIRAQTNTNQEDLFKLIAIGRLAIRIQFPGIYLHPTQVLTILGLLLGNRGCIAQVKTGEGKSKIVMLQAFILTMLRRNVHIISSSRQLAIRDQTESLDFFKIFAVTSSHICTDTFEKKQFQAQILYGTATDFQFAIMQEMLFFKSLFHEKRDELSFKRFDCAIIDEVDNLTIDTALNGARVSFPSEISYEWVYAPIFKFVQDNFKISDSITSPTVIAQLKDFLNKYMNGRFSLAAKQLSDKQLKKWLQSAHHALFNLKEKKDYVIGNEKKGKGILIVDAENTGRIMHGSRWSGAVHEFVEAKHNIEVDRESLTPISLSNSIFYQMYHTLFGLTGTLGSKSERELIKEVYSMDSFDVPTNKPQIRTDSPPMIVTNDQMHLQMIIEKIKECHQKGRPILVLCRTIAESEIIEEVLKSNGLSFEMLNEIQEKRESEIIENAGLQRAITVATNTAGRGMDIKPTKGSTDLGGLHVLITFYPESERVENQARGRAGRQGQPGSSEILISAKSNDQMTHKQMEHFLADLAERRHIRERVMKYTQSCRTKVERSLFSLLNDFFNQLQKFHQISYDEYFLNKNAAALDNLVLQADTQLNFSNLHAKDRQIAGDAFGLLTTGKGSIIHWKTLLQQVGKRVKEKAIHYWSLDFYAEVEIMIKESKLEKNSLIRLNINQAMELSAKRLYEQPSSESLFHLLSLQEIENQCIASAEKELKTLLDRIKNLYNEKKQQWEKSLHLSGNGVLEYLYEITGIKKVLF